MIVLIELAVLLGLLSLVLWRRAAAKRWVAGARSSAPNAPEQSFPKVWLQLTRPRASMLAYRDRTVGTLTTHPDTGTATFVTKHGVSSEIGPVTDVEMGGRGSDFVNTWLEVSVAGGAVASRVWVNDGGWFGWRPLLTRSNHRIADALQRLTEPGHRGPGDPGGSPA